MATTIRTVTPALVREDAAAAMVDAGRILLREVIDLEGTYQQLNGVAAPGEPGAPPMPGVAATEEEEVAAEAAAFR